MRSACATVWGVSMRRTIIYIDHAKCDGCGNCVSGCAEGAIQVIDGKARLVSDVYCDGLGACVGHCPQGAITVEEREAEAFDAQKALAHLERQGLSEAQALQRQKHEQILQEQAQKHRSVLRDIRFDPAASLKPSSAKPSRGGGCPGSRILSFEPRATPASTPAGSTASQPSALGQWPIQLRLVSPHAPYFQNADLLLAADCAPCALGDFHSKFLQGRSLAIACPKLDDHAEEYVEKLAALIDGAKLNSITVLMMEVPCCSRLLGWVREAQQRASRQIPIQYVVVGLQGDIVRTAGINPAQESPNESIE